MYRYHYQRRPIFVAPLALLMFAKLMFANVVVANEPKASDVPKPIPQTRPETKSALEKLKQREARLPLPPADAGVEPAATTGSRLGGVVNNGRMRALYLPAFSRSGGLRQRDPAMTLDPTFSVELFWIASRVNNCHYCLGHQEVKLRSAGVTEDRLAALDCDWSRFTPAEQAAYNFARKLTFEPQLINDGDVAELRRYYQPNEVLEIIFSVARYNATNRWTDSLGIPQEEHRELLTETAANFLSTPTVVAPASIGSRGPLPSQAETLQQWAKCRVREPRLAVRSPQETRDVLAELAIGERPPQWMCLLANFPLAGKGAVEGYLQASREGQLAAELKAEIAWIAARQDRAWYAMGHAARRLRELNYDLPQIFPLDRLESSSPERQAARALAAKLTATPQAITDADIAAVRQHFNDFEVAEIVYHTTQAAFFNRVTEAANLPLEFDVN